MFLNQISQADTNKDGVISFQELLTIIRSGLAGPMQPDEMKNMYNNQSGMMSNNDFMSGMPVSNNGNMYGMPNNGFMSSMPGMPNNSNISGMMPNWNNGQIPNGRNLAIGDLGHTKALNNNSSNNSNRTFGTNNYLAPESFEPKEKK